MLTKKQIEERRNYIGGSDAAAVLGLSRWSTPLRVWGEKTGQLEPEDISGRVNIRLGNKLEQAVAEFFMEETGKKVHRVNETIFHAEYPMLGANIDRRVVGEDAILECKTASTWLAKEWEGEEIPQEYIIQVLHYLGVTGKKYAYIAVLIGNSDFKWKRIDRDDIAIREMQKKALYFWQEFVVPKVMPMNVSYKDSDTLYQLFPHAIPESVLELDDNANILIEQRSAMLADMKSVEAQIERVNNELKAILKENEAGESDRYMVTWKEQTQQRVDSKKLEEEFPKIHAQVLKPTSFRVLRVKEKK